MPVSEEYYKFDCEDCGETVLVNFNPNENGGPKLCPEHSTVDVDYSVSPEDCVADYDRLDATDCPYCGVVGGRGSIAGGAHHDPNCPKYTKGPDGSLLSILNPPEGTIAYALQENVIGISDDDSGKNVDSPSEGDPDEDDDSGEQDTA